MAELDAPGQPLIVYNIGLLLAEQGELAAATAHFEKARQAAPGFAPASFHLGVVFLRRAMMEAAAAAFRMAIDVDPEHYEAHRLLGLSYLARGELGRAMDHLAWTYELRRGEARTGIAAASMRRGNLSKLVHDFQQFAYLSQVSRSDGRKAYFGSLAARFRQIAAEIGDEPIELTPEQLGKLGPGYNLPVSVCSAPSLAHAALAERGDRLDLLNQLLAEGAVSIAGLLCPAAIGNLRKQLLESTIWHDFGHIEGQVATFLEDGFASPLLLQIVDEFRTLFPEVLAQRPLKQAWAFRGVLPGRAIGAHVDDAEFSLNFWLTPDRANLNPGTGGMRICLTEPEDWEIADYESDSERAVQFLEQHSERCVSFPYGYNSAVFFRSRLAHASDQPEFDEGFENQRINITLLFGPIV